MVMTAAGTEFAKLARYLESDPNNHRLIEDCALAAAEAGVMRDAHALAERLRDPEGGEAPALALHGLVEMRAGNFASAAEWLEQALHAAPLDPAIRFNLAWCRGMAKDWTAVTELITDDVAGAIRRAASLKVHAIHQMGQPDEALQWGRPWAERDPGERNLMSAMAVAALDAEDPVLAERFARAANGSHEGLSTLGALRLAENDLDGSDQYFDQALAASPTSGRALLGKGMTLLMQGHTRNAQRHLDRSTEVFHDHLGAWVASAWSYFVSGDLDEARARFEKALAIDDTFAEIHGGLAVLDANAGDLDEARRRVKTALRLDPNCLSAALANSLILTARGRETSAERVRRAALNQPVGPNGQTIAEAMIKLTGKVTPRSPCA